MFFKIPLRGQASIYDKLNASTTIGRADETLVFLEYGP
jgi:hypothetical protein